LFWQGRDRFWAVELMPEELTDVRQISRIAYGFMGSKALFAALDLGLFDIIAAQPATLDQISEKTAVAKNRMATLLSALVGLGFLVRVEKSYTNARATQRYKLIFPSLLGLTDGLLGKATQSMQQMLADPDDAALFSEAQHQGSMGPAVLLSRRLNLTGCTSLLDVAGGSGAFSIVRCRRYPGLSSIILDFPGVIEVSRRYVEASQLNSRIALIGGDALEDDWPDHQDVVLMSYLLSAVGESSIPTLLDRAWHALSPGGLLVLHDFMLDVNRDGPREAALWFLFYTVQRSDSSSFTAGDLVEQLDHRDSGPNRLGAGTQAGLSGSE